MAGHQCPIRYLFSHKARVNVKNGRLKAIKVALSLSRRPIHALMFEVGFKLQSPTTTQPIIKEALIHLGH
jgi:hypothetical protein